jgi:hypothetical protein
MTALLEKAFEQATKLPEEEQNALAQWLLIEMESEKDWSRAFADSEDVLAKLADEAIEAKRQGRTTPLDVDRL